MKENPDLCDRPTEAVYAARGLKRIPKGGEGEAPTEDGAAGAEASAEA